jgi:hypothetical protein
MSNEQTRPLIPEKDKKAMYEIYKKVGKAIPENAQLDHVVTALCFIIAETFSQVKEYKGNEWVFLQYVVDEIATIAEQFENMNDYDR